MKGVWHWTTATVTAVLLLLTAGCASPYEPDVHPTHLSPIEQTHDFRSVDLDGNGRDELVRRGSSPGGPEQSVFIRSLSGRAVAQVNFTGRLPRLEFADVTRDGRLEIIAPVVQADSMFYNMVSANGEKLARFFAVSGEPRREPGGTIRWDFRSTSLRLSDVTGDEASELISFFTTGFARQPRGVWIHTYPEGRQVGHQRIGALVRAPSYFGDVDDDASPEWLFGSKSTNNGANTGGFSDDRAYLGAIEVTSSPKVEWRREMGETFSAARLRHGDLTGDGQPEFIALRVPRAGRQEKKSPLHHIDPVTGKTLQRYTPEAILHSVHVGTLGKNGDDRVLPRNANGTLRLLGPELDVLRERTFEEDIQSVQVLTDVNGDGRDEIVVHTEAGTLWLRPDLTTLAATQRRGNWQVVRTGLGTSPRITIAEEEGSMTHFRAVENSFWWAYRYGPVAGLLLGVLVVVGGGLVGARRYRQLRLREAVHEQVVTHSDREWLLVHPRRGIQRTSTGVSRLLGVGEEQAVDRAVLRERVPKLADHLERLAADPAGPEAEEITVEGQVITVSCTPLEITRNGRSYWLVWLDPSTSDKQYRVQSLMAQRVAHDLKNPLTSILLTLQRMQMAYRERDSALADTLDNYTGRIEERIASLRRMTTNVLKFVGKEGLRRTPTDLSAYLDELAGTIEQGLPPDIELRRGFDDDLPAAAVDHDQLRSAVENLVSNAVEAMPEGGVLTLSTRLARDLCFEEDPTARDYVIVEVRDTGVGMTAAERTRLFEPGFSGRDNTGLGMTLVQKVVDDHDGRIEVESEPDVGTSTTLYLPTDSDAAASTS